MVIEERLVFPVILTLAFLADQCIGDPPWLPHPVRIIGRFIGYLDARLRIISKTPSGQRFAGLSMAIFVIALTFLAAYGTVWLMKGAPGLHMLPGMFLLVYLTATTLALRELIKAGTSIIDAIEKNNIVLARKRLSMVVGRDVHNLDEKAVLKAVIETLSENLSDGVIAPLFYLTLGGLPLGLAYKAVNTLDSMVGYKNAKYRYFGWASARIDDLFNFIPARLSGLLIVFCTAFVYRSWGFSRRSFMTMLRDGNKHLSPNSGYPEAAAAGALGVQLGGPSAYFGSVVEKPYIGKEYVSNYFDAAKKMILLVRTASWCAFLLALGCFALLRW